MFSLTFDTTSSAVSVALFQDKTCLDSVEEEMEFGQAEALMKAIEKLLSKNRLTFADLSLLTVCTGPGSFTGVRSSLAAARTFGLACPKLTLCGISAFDAYAADLAPDERAEINAVLIETKRDDFYVQYYNQKLEKLGEPSASLDADIQKRLTGLKVSLSGDAVERFLNRPRGLSLHAVKLYQQVPLQSLANVGLAKFASGKADYPKPLYIKAPDVCIK